MAPLPDVARSSGGDAELAPPGVDTALASPARLYDYYLGGTHNFQADRDLAQQMLTIVPEMPEIVRANREFHVRAAAWMTGQGIRQFLDIGSGLPTQSNTHQTVQAVDPAARVVYVDNDPIVAAHSGALLADNGTTALIVADLRDPDAILGHPRLRELIDLSEPVGVFMTAVLHFIADESDPWALVAGYMSAVAPGSYLAISHGTADRISTDAVESGLEVYGRSSSAVHLRSKPEVQRFFAGMELQPPTPGSVPEVTYTYLWGAGDAAVAPSPAARSMYCAVARRP
jgi:S-adenosyl methyltransferase